MDDLSRLRNEYDDRTRRFSGSDLYSWFNTANLFAVHERQRAVLRALKGHGLVDLSKVKILEMGCGGGGVMAEFLAFGAPPETLYGIDLLYGRLLEARDRLPGSQFANGEGSLLPFPSGAFDLILQYTAISSILDAKLRRNICAELLRVLRPNGLILSYDFWWNPTNKQTRGLRPKEIRESFPGCRITFQRITLAPPIARGLASASWGLCTFLESLKLFNTHYLAAIRPVQG